MALFSPQLQACERGEETMGGEMKKGFSVALILMVMLLTKNVCRATSAKSNDTHAHRCSDQPEECLIGDMDSQEYSVDSEISRRLLQVNSGQAVTGRTSNANQPAVPCGNARYDACLPKPNRSPSDGQKCGIYNRGCPQ
ncbi:hypothetical protein AAG906_013429 [Vitis piasezkii]